MARTAMVTSVTSGAGAAVVLALATLGALAGCTDLVTDPAHGARPTHRAGPLIASEPAVTGQIAFASYQGGGGSAIYVANLDGTGITRLTAPFGALDMEPAWSFDGTRIAFTSCRPDPGSCDIYVMTADGSDIVRWTSTGSNSQPAWSPDGRRIAFASRGDGNSEIYVVDAAGETPVRLTDHPGEDTDPAWSPDGTRIAFTSDREGPLDVHLMNPDGSGVARLTNGVLGTLSYLAPAWSPDGHRIAYIGMRCDGYEAWCPFNDWWGYGGWPDFSIEVANADGSGVTRVASTPARNDLALTAFIDRPAWSPDGGTVAFTGRNVQGAGFLSIAYVRADGSSGVVVVADGYAPSWRR